MLVELSLAQVLTSLGLQVCLQAAGVSRSSKLVYCDRKSSLRKAEISYELAFLTFESIFLFSISHNVLVPEVLDILSCFWVAVFGVVVGTLHPQLRSEYVSLSRLR